MLRVVLAIVCFIAIGESAMAEGVNLSWDDCGMAGTAVRFHDCADDAAFSELYGSFVPPAGIDQFQGMVAELLVSAPEQLPDWWRFEFLGCRDASDFVVESNYASPTCANVFIQPTEVQGYQAGLPGPNRLRIRIGIGGGIEETTALEAGREYFAFRARIKNPAPGSGSGGPCLGCEAAVCLTLMSIQLFQPAVLNNDPILTEPVDRAHVTWQSDIAERCPFSVPVKNATWGQVRSIYR